MHNPAMVIDNSGRIVMCNTSAEKAVSRSRETLLGKPLTSILNTSRLHTILKTGKAESVQKIVIGAKAYISNRTPVMIEGKMVGAMASLRTHYQEELERLKSQSAQDSKYIIVSKKMGDVFALALRLSKVDSTVLI